MWTMIDLMALDLESRPDVHFYSTDRNIHCGLRAVSQLGYIDVVRSFDSLLFVGPCCVMTKLCFEQPRFAMVYHQYFEFLDVSN